MAWVQQLRNDVKLWWTWLNGPLFVRLMIAYHHSISALNIKWNMIENSCCAVAVLYCTHALLLQLMQIRLQATFLYMSSWLQVAVSPWHKEKKNTAPYFLNQQPGLQKLKSNCHKICKWQNCSFIFHLWQKINQSEKKI